MANDRDDILNELIKYYDGDEPTQEPDDMSATRVMPAANKSEPADEAFGNTVVVNVKKKPKPAAEDPVEEEPAIETAVPDIDDDEEIKVYTPTARKLPPISEPAEEKPVDEVLGNLDFIGMPIVEPIIPSAEVKKTEEPIVKPAEEPAYTADPVIEEAMKKRKGFWYSTKPLWVTIICCAIAAAGLKFYITNDGIIGTYKRNFNYNMGLIFNMIGLEWKPPTYTLPTIGAAAPKAMLLTANTPVELNTEPAEYTEEDNVREKTDSAYFSVKEAHLLPFDDADSSVISVFGNGVVCARSNYMCYIDGSGKIAWESDTAITDPVISTRGSYIAIAARGGTQLSLYKRSKLIYSIDIPNNIRACEVSLRGDVALITDKPSYKGAVLMVNPKGETVFSWASGVNYITAVNVLRNRRIAVALANAEKSVTAYVMLFDINSVEPFTGMEIGNSLIYTLDTNGKLVYINADNDVSCMTQGGSFRYDLRFEDAVITHSATDKFGNRLISYTDDNTPAMSLYNKRGIPEATIITEGEPDFIDVYKNTVIYNNGRDIICGKADDEKKVLYTASRTITSLKLADADTAAVLYKDSIEIIGF